MRIASRLRSSCASPQSDLPSCGVEPRDQDPPLRPAHRRAGRGPHRRLVAGPPGAAALRVPGAEPRACRASGRASRRAVARGRPTAEQRLAPGAAPVTASKGARSRSSEGPRRADAPPGRAGLGRLGGGGTKPAGGTKRARRGGLARRSGSGPGGARDSRSRAPPRPDCHMDRGPPPGAVGHAPGGARARGRKWRPTRDGRAGESRAGRTRGRGVGSFSGVRQGGAHRRPLCPGQHGRGAAGLRGHSRPAAGRARHRSRTRAPEAPPAVARRRRGHGGRN